MQQQKLIWGWVFIASGSLFFLGFLYAAVISKLLPPSDNPIVSAIQSDRGSGRATPSQQGSPLYEGRGNVYRKKPYLCFAKRPFPRLDHMTFRYYCFLVPLTLPVLVVAVYFHWLSMKLFKHA